MRLRKTNDLLQNTATLTAAGGTFNSSIFLQGYPTGNLNAVRKETVDNLVFNASVFGSGTIPAAGVPQFVGDVTNGSGGTVFSLPVLHTGKNGTRPTFNAMGFITGYTALTAADIPNLDYSKITSGKPTTASALGLADAMLLGTETLTPPVQYASNVSLVGQPLAICRKKDIDQAYGDGSGEYKLGDIVEFPVTATPFGFLECNGGAFAENSFKALYDKIVGRYGTASAGYAVLPDLSAFKHTGKFMIKW